MIKIDPAKNFTAPQSGSSKTNLSSSEGENRDGIGGEVQGSSDFASVLENLSSKKDSSDQKTDLNEPKEHEKDSHSKLEEQDHKTEQPSKDKTNNREDAAGAAVAGRFNTTDNSQFETALPVPPARAILHIIDLERIISSVRAQNFDGNSQVVITLKNSVCSGLQIRLTSDENHRITAELIAGNEKVKTQIDARSGELADLLRQRGLKLTSLQTSVGSEMSGESGNRQQSDNLETRTVSANSAKNLEPEVEQAFDVSETASNYRV
jgi:hypothetical protein